MTRLAPTPPRSLTRSIDGDRPLARRERAAYVAEGVTDLVESLFEEPGATPLRLTDAEIDAIAALRGGNLRVSSQRMYFRHVCVLLRRQSEGKLLDVLDVGCGSGAYSDVFKKGAPGTAYTGVDIRAHENWTKEAAKRDGLARGFLALDLSSNPLPWRGRFDLTVSFSSLEHIGGLNAALREVFAASKPGSRHLHAVPSHWTLFTYWFHGRRRFSAKSLRWAFESAGFCDVSITTLGGAFTFALDKLFLLNPVLLKLKPVLPSLYDRAAALHARLLPSCLRLDRRAPFFANTYVVSASKPS